MLFPCTGSVQSGRARHVRASGVKPPGKRTWSTEFRKEGLDRESWKARAAYSGPVRTYKADFGETGNRIGQSLKNSGEINGTSRCLVSNHFTASNAKLLQNSPSLRQNYRKPGMAAKAPTGHRIPLASDICRPPPPSLPSPAASAVYFCSAAIARVSRSAICAKPASFGCTATLSNSAGSWSISSGPFTSTICASPPATRAATISRMISR